MVDAQKWVRKSTGEVVDAVRWLPGETDNEVSDLILSNVEEGDVPLGEEMGFVNLTMAICDAHPKDWVIAEPDRTYALTQEAFDRAFVPFVEEN